MCIAVVCFPDYDVINPEISNQTVFIHDQRVKKKFEYLKNEKSIKVK